MPVPQPRSPSLDQAVRDVAAAAACPLRGESRPKSGLSRIFARRVFQPPALREDSRLARLNSAVLGGEGNTINVIRYTVRVHVFRRHLDNWMGKAAPLSGRSATISLDDAWVGLSKPNSAPIGSAR